MWLDDTGYLYEDRLQVFKKMKHAARDDEVELGIGIRQRGILQIPFSQLRGNPFLPALRQHVIGAIQTVNFQPLLEK